MKSTPNVRMWDTMSNTKATKKKKEKCTVAKKAEGSGKVDQCLGSQFVRLLSQDLAMLVPPRRPSQRDENHSS